MYVVAYWYGSKILHNDLLSTHIYLPPVRCTIDKVSACMGTPLKGLV